MSKGTLDRIAAIWRANVNEVLDQLEDPEKLVPQLVRDMEDSVDRAVAALGKAVANEKLPFSTLQATASGAKRQFSGAKRHPLLHRARTSSAVR